MRSNRTAKIDSCIDVNRQQVDWQAGVDKRQLVTDGPMTYGYIRVSTREQNEARQVDAMKQFGVDYMLMDKQSGKDFDRPAYKKLLEELRPGEISLPKWIQSHKGETTHKSLEIRHFTAFAPFSAALGRGRFFVLWV